MNKRTELKGKIIHAFSILENEIKINNGFNLQDRNVNLEDLFRDLFNKLYTDRKFRNLNTESGNHTAIDLADDKDDYAIQVTSTTERSKVTETINKYKKSNKYNKLFMQYSVIDKPKRTSDFNDIINGSFDFEERDLKDLVGEIIDCDLEKLKEITAFIEEDILVHFDSYKKVEDISAIEQWEEVELNDSRNMPDKLLSVCNTIKEARINKYCRDIASGKIELRNYSERYVSAIKYRIFEVCQEELLNFVEENEAKELTVEEINGLIDRYTDRAVEIIEDKAQEYAYPIKNRDLLKKTVLALIDECYLSFDEEGIYVD